MPSGPVRQRRAGCAVRRHRAGTVEDVENLGAFGVQDEGQFQATDLPWHLNFSSYDAATGVVTGTVSHIQIMVSGSGCTFVIDGTSGTASDGTVRFTYSDSTGHLTVLATSGNLHVWNVSVGCLGLVDTGDRATLSGTSTVSPKQAITSP